MRGESKRSDDLLGRKTLAQQAEIEILVPLGQTASVHVAQQRNVYEVRRFKAEQAVQPDLARRAGNEVASANDLGHARQAVIDRHGELVGENAVRAPDNENHRIPPPGSRCTRRTRRR